MRRTDAALFLLFAAALAAGSVTYRDHVQAPPRVAGGWLVAGDFHVHAFPGDGVLAPAQLRREAARRNLHVIALTNHNHMLENWLWPRATRERLPLLLPGAEITTAAGHVIAAGADDMVRWQDGLRAAIDGVHAQGGVGILAHPEPDVESTLDEATLSALDAVEVANGPTFQPDQGAGASLYRDWRSRRVLAAIGSSDFHQAVPIGVQRTVLLVHALNEQGVLEAIREGRTAVRFTSEWVGDSTVIRVAATHQDKLFDDAPRFGSLAGAAACAMAWLALLALVLRS